MVRLLLVFIVISVIAAPAVASKPSTAGLSRVTAYLEGDRFVWDLYNPSGPGDGNPEWDILIWSLEPSGLPEPREWSAPPGWSWKEGGHGGFRIDESSRKYEVGGPAAEPGEHLSFSYSFEGADAYVGRLSFVAHVAAVSGMEGQGNGLFRWISVQTPNGRTWFDTPGVQLLNPPVGEPAGLLVLGFGLTAALGALRRR